LCGGWAGGSRATIEPVVVDMSRDAAELRILICAAIQKAPPMFAVTNYGFEDKFVKVIGDMRTFMQHALYAKYSCTHVHIRAHSYAHKHARKPFARVHSARCEHFFVSFAWEMHV